MQASRQTRVCRRARQDIGRSAQKSPIMTAKSDKKENTDSAAAKNDYWNKLANSEE